VYKRIILIKKESLFQLSTAFVKRPQQLPLHVISTRENCVPSNTKARHTLTSYSREFSCELPEARGKAHHCTGQGTE